MRIDSLNNDSFFGKMRTEDRNIGIIHIPASGRAYTGRLSGNIKPFGNEGRCHIRRPVSAVYLFRNFQRLEIGLFSEEFVVEIASAFGGIDGGQPYNGNRKKAPCSRLVAIERT
ncbi:hypothetical protein [Pontiella sulfatireligans]|uniref:hypothetical protein n=1 Tax=Pontiella sulfatireligans TaxID=2750658 RepID=UPI00109CDABA|nr:hypothetical protein [Pontiella sulfatireligans]